MSSHLRKGRQAPADRQLSSEFQEEPCILFGVETLAEDGGETEEVECQLQGFDRAKASSAFVKVLASDKETWETIVREAHSASGQITLLARGATIVGNDLYIPSDTELTWAKLRNNSRRKKGRALQTLASTTFTVLVVRVTDSKGLTPSRDAAGTSDKVFGTGGDAVNLKERVEACSQGLYQIIPFSGKTSTGVDISDGVYDFTVSFEVENKLNEDAVDETIVELEEKLGKLQEQFDEIFVVLPEGSDSKNAAIGKKWVAFARLNYFVAGFNDENVILPKVQLHEIGK